MAQRVRTLIKGKLYLRQRDLEKVVANTDDIIRAYRVRAFNEMSCRSCPHLDERFSREHCGPCEHYNGKIELAERLRIDGNKYISLPLGAQRSIERKLDIKLKVPEGFDLRKYPAMAKRYKLTIDLYDGTPAPDGTTRINQEKAVEDWLAGGGIGVIRAGARSGKTVLAVAISVKLRLKTLVVTDSTDLLDQFWDTYCGDGVSRICATNMPAERVIKINKMEDFLKPHDVALINYQKLIRETADARIEAFIRGKYGLLVGDEVHMAAAQAYASFLLKLDVPFRLGLSATPKRKDGRYHVAEAVYGPVIVSLNKVGLKPLVKIHRTGRFAGRSQRAWHMISAMIVEDKVRNKQIVDQAFAAIDRGHKAALIALDQTEHIDNITEMLNDRAYEEHRKNRNLPEITAMKIDGRTVGKARKAKFDEFDAEGAPYKFLVAQRKIVKQGIDLKRPSCVIMPIPMSAKPGEGAPLFEQLSWRGSTPYHGKCQPEAIVFADDSGVLEGIINGLLRWEVMKNDVAQVGDKRGIYHVDDSCYKFMETSGKSTNVSYGKVGGVVIRR
jgi:superfamily II DNA or RNA helicase